MKKLAIITTHPIQYNAPLFQLLNERNVIQIKVFYTWGQAQGELYDPGFKIKRTWDIPLLEGYDFEFINNISKHPGSHQFYGIDNPSIISKIIDFKPDAILVFGWNFKSHLKIMRFFKGKIPIIFRGDSTLLDEKDVPIINRSIRYIMLRWIYQFIDYALYVGKSNKEYFLRHNVDKKQLIFAPHAIDNRRFMHISDEEELDVVRLKENLNINDTNFVFMYAGKLESKKNINLLIIAFLNCRNPFAKLLIVGNGPQEQEMKQLSRADNRIIFMDFQNQGKMPIVYRLANVFILPSRGPGETWGLSVNEAMACGVPAIVSNKVGCAADLIDPTTGWVFNWSSSDELTNTLRKILLKSYLVPKIANAAKLKIKEYNFEKIADTIENLIK